MNEPHHSSLQYLQVWHISCWNVSGMMTQYLNSRQLAVDLWSLVASMFETMTRPQQLEYLA